MAVAAGVVPDTESAGARSGDGLAATLEENARLRADGFIAMLFTERYVAGRSMNSLVTGLARQGADVSPATLAGTIRPQVGRSETDLDPLPLTV